MKSMRVHEKTTWSSRMGTIKLRDDDELKDLRTRSFEKKTEDVPDSPGVLDGRRREKENLSDFISKKRDMFLVQMAIETKREEIQKLEQKVHFRFFVDLWLNIASDPVGASARGTCSTKREDA